MFDVAEHLQDDEATLSHALTAHYPSFSKRVIADLLPLVIGNQQYVQDICKQERPVVEMEHKEQIIALGRGFDWLHLPNRALIIGPYHAQIDYATEVAGNIILGNMKAKRVPESEGALLLVAAPFRSIGADQGIAEQKALFLAAEAERVLSSKVPAIMKRLKILVGTTDLNTRKFHVLKRA
jgi:hypothetical protein